MGWFHELGSTRCTNSARGNGHPVRACQSQPQDAKTLFDGAPTRLMRHLRFIVIPMRVFLPFIFVVCLPEHPKQYCLSGPSQSVQIQYLSGAPSTRHHHGFATPKMFSGLGPLLPCYQRRHAAAAISVLELLFAACSQHGIPQRNAKHGVLDGGFLNRLLRSALALAGNLQNIPQFVSRGASFQSVPAWMSSCVMYNL